MIYVDSKRYGLPGCDDAKTKPTNTEIIKTLLMYLSTKYLLSNAVTYSHATHRLVPFNISLTASAVYHEKYGEEHDHNRIGHDRDTCTKSKEIPAECQNQANKYGLAEAGDN